MKQVIYRILAFSIVLSALCGSAQATPSSSSSSIISTALSQLDYEEGVQSYSSYGQWYGIPNGDWCDMFVSWCANQAGIPTSVFPKSASCTTHVRLFSRKSPYYVSAARGGTYIPKQGDVIFFYNYPKYPNADVLRHVGIVLCVENGHVFTIEGNTLTNRLDYPFYESVIPLRKADLEPKDYVAVKCYPLDEPQIHGYAVPNYSDTSAFKHTGWVDLGKYESLRKIFDTLAAQDIMTGTSSYTFSPRYGMTRGDFIVMVMKLYGLYGWEAKTEPFDDVSENNAHYDAVMTARSAGIVFGSGSNKFFPDTYISGPEAQAIISRALDYVGQENQTFDFTEGDFSYMLTPYTIRADIAKALYALLSEMSTPVVSSVKILLHDDFLEWPVLNIDGSNYVPIEMLMQILPTLATVPDPEDEILMENSECELNNELGADPETVPGLEDQDTSIYEEEPKPPANQPTHLPIPMNDTNHVFLSSIHLQNDNTTTDVPSFNYKDIQYVMLRPAANFFGVDILWNEENKTIELFWLGQ